MWQKRQGVLYDGDNHTIRKMMGRSCLRYYYCADSCCGFASHEI